MRVLFGIILGVILTVGGAYLYDSHNALNATTAANAPNAPASAQRPLVNWEAVNTTWQHLTVRAKSEWARISG